MITDTTLATLRVEKTYSMPFQEITVVDDSFTEWGRKTLSEADNVLTLSLQPGEYMISGFSPSGTRTNTPVTLEDGQSRTVTADITEDSPHEWLADLNARQQLPETVVNLSKGAVEMLGSHSVFDMLALSPVASLSLPTNVVSYAARGLVDQALKSFSKRKNQTSRPMSSTRRPQDISLKTYWWSSDDGRWLRSNLIDKASGEYALDYTRLYFPSRELVDDRNKEKIHLVGASFPGRPTKYIALPLFADGAQLVLSHTGGLSPVTNENVPESILPNKGISWRLSAVDMNIDALLQALKGRGYENRDALSEEAFKIAERFLQDKRMDPEAAVVTDLFLLQYRRLDRRAQWVDNLAQWFPWSPDALALGAWANILFETGDEAEVLGKLSEIYKAGPPQFLPTRRLLRDLISIRMADGDEIALAGDTRELLAKLWARLGREMQSEIPGGPFYSFEKNPGAKSKP